MQILNTAASLPSTPLDKLALYSAMDVLSLYEIKSGLMSLMDPGRLATYEFEMELQSALLDLSFNGIPVDEGARRELIVEFSKEQEELTTLLNRLLEEIGYFDYYRAMAVAEFSASLKPSVMNTVVDLSTTPLSSLVPSTWDEWKALPLSVRRVFKNNSPTALTTFQKALKSLDEPFNPNSPAQKLQLFYHFFGSPANTVAQEFFFAPPWLKTYGIPEYKSRNTKNEYTPAADRAALEKIVKASDSGPAYAAFWAAPFAHICITLADLAKSLGFLKCNLEHGLFKASFGAVTDTGRLSSRQNAQGYGSNAQNVTPKLRHIFVSPPTEKFCAGDYSQIESRNVAAICYQLFGLKNYIAATESGDLHSLAASMVWPDLPWPEDFTIDWTLKHGPFPKDMIKAAKAIASVEFYRGKSRRDVSKILGHGTSYMGRPPQMSKHSHIEVKLIEHYQDVFFGMFLEVKMWHRWVVEQVQTKGEITTFLGRTRRFFGRPNDDATIRKAVAYEPQSVAADYCNRALLRLHRLALAGDFPATIRLSKHDELVVTCEESLEEQVIATMVAQMEEHITLTSPTGETRDWFVPVEIESGWNMGRKSDSNPNGLSHPLDGRTRIDLSSWKVWKM
jgi:hypothetical protein